MGFQALLAWRFTKYTAYSIIGAISKNTDEYQTWELTWLVPPAPDPWLAQAMIRQPPILCKWSDHVLSSLLLSPPLWWQLVGPPINGVTRPSVLSRPRCWVAKMWWCPSWDREAWGTPFIKSGSSWTWTIINCCYMAKSMIWNWELQKVCATVSYASCYKL